MSSFSHNLRRLSSASTLVDSTLQFEGTPTEQGHKQHFIDLLSLFGRAHVTESYFRSWCQRNRPSWTDLFFSQDGWDASKFRDVLGGFRAMSLGSMSGSCWDFKFILEDRARSRVRNGLGDRKRSYILELSSLLASYLDNAGCFKMLSAEEQDILQHIDACIQHSPPLFEQIDEQAAVSCETMILFAETYQDAGRYKDAEKLLRTAMERELMVSGPQHPRFWFIAEHVGLNCMLQGSYDEAEKLFEGNVQAKKKTLGPWDLSVLQSMENLANCFRNRGQYARAEDQFLRIIWRTKKPWATLRNNLAILRSEQGRYEEAEEMFEELLEERITALGTQHPDTLSAMHNLAALYGDVGKLEESESTARKALVGKVNTVGSAHPDVFATVKVLAMLCLKKGMLEEAWRLLRKALKDGHEALDPDHPQMIGLLDGLVIVHAERGQLGKARNLAQRAFALSAVRYGSKHPETLAIVQSLGLVHRMEGNLGIAEGLYREILREDTTAKYLQVKYTMHNLVGIYWTQGRDDEADQLRSRSQQGGFANDFCLPSQVDPFLRSNWNWLPTAW